MNIRQSLSHPIWYALAGLILVGGFIFWVSDLNSDPPMYFSGLGQSLGTDPAQYVYHARNEILWGDWDPFDHTRWLVYQKSLVSGLAWLVFSLSGVSLANAALVGVLLSLGALALFMLGAARFQRPWVLAAGGICYVLNVVLLTYGRLSYLENGLVFLAAAMFFVLSWWGDRIWGQIVAGALVALATLLGKVFGLLLLPPLLLTVWLTSGARWRAAGIVAGSFVTSVVVAVLLLYGANLSAVAGYFGEQAYGLRGFPAGLSSPWGFVEHFISFGYSNRLYYLTPDIFMLLLLSGSLLVLAVGSVERLKEINRSLWLLLLWVPAIYLGIMPLNYSPLRYALLMVPALIFGFWSLADLILAEKKPFLQLRGRWSQVWIGLLGWILAFHVVRNVWFFNSPVEWWFVWSLLPVGVALALAAGRWPGKRRINMRPQTLLIGAAIVLALSMITNGARIRRLHYLDHVFSIHEANTDMGEILGPDAVVSGPYGPVLTLNTELRSFIHLIGAVAEVDSNLFSRQPITHIAVDAADHSKAIEQFPQMDSAVFVTSYWIRDIEVSIYNISRLFDNPRAQAYQPSGYELARRQFDAGQIDSASASLQAFLTSHKMSKSPGMLAADLALKKGRFDQATQLMIALADECSTDFYLQMQCGRLLMIAAFGGNPALMERARDYFERGVAVNRFKGDYAMQLARQTTQMMQNRAAQPQTTQ